MSAHHRCPPPQTPLSQHLHQLPDSLAAEALLSEVSVGQFLLSLGCRGQVRKYISSLHSLLAGVYLISLRCLPTLWSHCRWLIRQRWRPDQLLSALHRKWPFKFNPQINAFNYKDMFHNSEHSHSVRNEACSDEWSSIIMFTFTSQERHLGNQFLWWTAFNGHFIRYTVKITLWNLNQSNRRKRWFKSLWMSPLEGTNLPNWDSI